MGFGKDGKGVIIRETATVALLTLAANTGISLTGGVGSGLLERFRIIKTEFLALIIFGTFVSGDGPIELYLVDADLTLAEAEAAIEATGPLGPNDRVGAEVAQRWTKAMGAIPFVPENEGPGSLLNGGMIVEQTIRWTFAPAKGWRWHAQNFGNAITTGATIKVRAKHFGVWVT